jgi:hypothetical protein
MLGPFHSKPSECQMSWGPHFSAWPHPRRLGCPLPRLGAIADGERCGECGQPKNEPTPKIQNHNFLMVGFQPSPNSSCSFYWVANTTPFHLPLREAPLVPGSFSSTGWVQGHVKSIKIMVSRGRLGLEPHWRDFAPNPHRFYVLYGLPGSRGESSKVVILSRFQVKHRCHFHIRWLIDREVPSLTNQ